MIKKLFFITLFGFSAKKLTQEIKETIHSKNCEWPKKMKQSKQLKVLSYFFEGGYLKFCLDQKYYIKTESAFIFWL